MKAMFGIGISRDAIRAVLVRDTSVSWAAEVALTDGSVLEEVIERMIREAPRRRGTRLCVSAAIGPGKSQVKRIEGLPAGTDEPLLATVIHTSPGSFFLKNGIDLKTGGVVGVEAGVAWASAIEAPVVDAVRTACRSARARLVHVLPSAVVLPYALDSVEFTWYDGEIAIDVTRCEADLVSVIRRHCKGIHEQPADLPISRHLRGLGERAVRFADAYGAAVCRDGKWLALSVLYRYRQTRGPYRLFAVPALLALLGVVLLLSAPLRTIRQTRAADASISSIRQGDGWKAMEAASDQLSRVSNVLHGVDDFHAARHSRTALLSDIVGILPESVVLLRIDVEDSNARIVALAPRIGEVVDVLGTLDGLAGVRLAGPIATSHEAGQLMERGTIAFSVSSP